MGWETMILCDTNIFISAFNFHEPTIEALKQIEFVNIVIPSVAVLELYRGMTNKAELSAMRKKLIYYDIIHLDHAASAQAIFLLEKFKLSHNLQIPDALIGATAIANDLPLSTYNVKDFSFMPGLTLYKPPTS